MPIDPRISARNTSLSRDQLRELIELIEAARGKNLNRPRFGSPITALLRFSIGEGLELMVRHQQRHLLQIQETVAALNKQT